MEGQCHFEKAKTLFSKLLELSSRTSLLQQKYADHLPRREVCDGGYNAEIVNFNVPQDLGVLENGAQLFTRHLNDNPVTSPWDASSGHVFNDSGVLSNGPNSGDEHLLCMVSAPVFESGLNHNNEAGYNVQQDSSVLSNGPYLNDKHLLYTASAPVLDIGVNHNNDAGYNANLNLSKIDYTEHVMGIIIPKNSSFDDNRLSQLLNRDSHDTANYFYFLFGDSNADIIVDNVDVGERMEQKNDAEDDEWIDVEYFDEMEQRSNIEIVVDAEELKRQNYGEPNFESQGREGRATFVIESLQSMANHIVKSAKVCSNIAPTVIESQHQIVKSANNLPETIRIKGHKGCDKRRMFVPTSDIKNKKLCCEYCRKRYPKLERHLRFVHKNEAAVKTFLALPPGSKGRRDAIARIRVRGEFIWNSDFELNGGELQTSRRPSKKFGTNPWRRIACANCMGSYSPNTLTKHWRKCASNSIKGERVAKELGHALEGRIHPDASDELNLIFAIMRDDEIIRMIRFDSLVTCYGDELCLNYSPHYQEGYIRSKLRAAAQVLHFSKEISPDITDMSSLFHVKKCNTVIEAIRKMGKFDRQSKLFGSPGTASTTVTLINKIGDTLINESMKSDDETTERNAERFLKVFRKEVKTKILKLVAITKAKNRRSKKLNIPTTADIKKLSQFVDVERETCYRKLTEKFSYGAWLDLAQLTLVTILVFNRRRAGEMRNMTISDYRGRELVADQPDMISEAISDEMKGEIRSRVIIRGKLDGDVAALLKHSWEDCIDLLIKHRKYVGIPTINDFLWAVPTGSMRVRCVNAWAAINSYAKSCGAENPSSLKGTNLRKHLASFSATKNLKDRDITNLAHFMGHKKEVHMNIYRNNPLVSQVSHLAPLLNEAQGSMNNRNKIANAESASDSDSEFDSDFDSEVDLDSNPCEDELEEVDTNKVKNRRIVRNSKKQKALKLSKKRATNANDVKVNRTNKAIDGTKANRATKTKGGMKTDDGTKTKDVTRANAVKKSEENIKSNGINEAKGATKANGGTKASIKSAKKIAGGQTKKRQKSEAPKKNKKRKVSD